MKKNRLLGIYLPLYILLAIASVTLKTIGAFYNLDRYGYYGGAVVMTIANLLVTAGAVFFLTYTLFSKKDIRLIPSFSSPMNYVPSGIAGAALVFIAVYLFGKANQLETNYIALFAAILAIASVAYFLLATVYEKRISARRASFGIIFLLFITLYVAYLYFDTALPINAPNKVVDQTAYLFIALFFLYEIRLSMGREKWRMYIAFGFIAALLSAYSAIPALIVYFIDGRVISNSIYESILTAALFIFISSKILLTVSLTEDRECAFVSGLKLSAAERDLELNPPAVEEADAADEKKEDDENQLSIIDIPEAATENESDSADEETVKDEI